MFIQIDVPFLNEKLIWQYAKLNPFVWIQLLSQFGASFLSVCFVCQLGLLPMSLFRNHFLSTALLFFFVCFFFSLTAGAKAIVCDQCGAQFPKEDDLEAHRQVHTGESLMKHLETWEHTAKESTCDIPLHDCIHDEAAKGKSKVARLVVLCLI